MKKLCQLLFVLSCCISLNAQVLPNQTVNGTNTQSTGNFTEELNMIAAASKENGNLLKAYLYEYGYPEENIKPDPEKSLVYYKKAFEEKNPIAAYKLGMIAWQIEEAKKEYKNTPLMYFLKANDFKPKEQARINLVAAGIYLYQRGDYKTAIETLTDATNAGHATAELYTALSYLSLKDMGNANQFLSRACTNKQQNDDIKNFCNSNTSVERYDIMKGSVIEDKYQTQPTCPMSNL